MIQYELDYKGFKCTVSLDVDKPDDIAAIEYDGDDWAISLAKMKIESSYGAFGHCIGDATTPIDLWSVMEQEGMKEFKPKLVKGGDIVENYELDIPEDALT